MRHGLYHNTARELGSPARLISTTRAGSALRVHDGLKKRPISSMQGICRTTGLSFPAASSGMDLLVELKIARELTGKRRNRLFAYDRYLEVLSRGTEPP